MSRASTALVVGGTGPTGVPIVEGLRQRGHEVAIFHTGRHEVPDLDDVEHLHGSPFGADSIREMLGAREFDVVVSTYGNLTAVADHFADRCGQLVAIGGIPVYRGYANPRDMVPLGMRIPTREDADLATGGSWPAGAYPVGKIRDAEERVFELGAGGAYDATVIRYPIIYGPRAPHPWEWSVVRRVIDRRPTILIPDGGLAIHSRCAARNAAAAVLAAVDAPRDAAGEAFNCGDEVQLSLRQWVEYVATCAGGEPELVSVPGDVPQPGWSMVAFANRVSPHSLLSIDKLKARLRYIEQITVWDALAESVEWLLARRDQYREDAAVVDAFDYDAEGRLLAAVGRSHGDLMEAGAPFLDVQEIQAVQTASRHGGTAP